MQASWWADFRAHVGYEHFANILRHEGVILGGGNHTVKVEVEITPMDSGESPAPSPHHEESAY